jgi:dihydrodipicolinate synthase/N-acetylneuraminate lyase
VAEGEGGNVLYSLGTTGEGDALNERLKRLNAETAIDEVKRIRSERDEPYPLEVAVDVSEPSVEATLDMAQYVQSIGADFLVLKPTYICRRNGHCTRKKNVDAALKVIDSVSAQFILYTHMGKQDQRHLKTKAVKALAKHP